MYMYIHPSMHVHVYPIKYERIFEINIHSFLNQAHSANKKKLTQGFWVTMNHKPCALIVILKFRTFNFKYIRYFSV